FAVCMLTHAFATMVAALALTSFMVGFHLGPIFAIAQTVARPSMRALASAFILLTATCFGQGVGPLAVGMINDALKSDYGNDAVRYSLLTAAVTTMLGALLFVWAARFIRADIKGAVWEGGRSSFSSRPHSLFSLLFSSTADDAWAELQLERKLHHEINPAGP